MNLKFPEVALLFQKIIIFILCVFSIFFSGNAFAEKVALGEQEAIHIAEEFVKNQGYTDTPVTLTKDQIVFESLEFYNDESKIIKYRHGTLVPKAYGAVLVKEYWLVVFEYTQPRYFDISRVVKVNQDGKNIQMQHQEFDRRNLTRLRYAKNDD